MSTKFLNRPQIGVIGSMADRKLPSKLRALATEIGREIAKKGAVLVFGFEGDFDSLSTIAAKAAEENGGETIAFLWGERGTRPAKLKSVRIETGQQRGGGREFPLILSCDCVISIGGGSGTLSEIAMAYQARVPVVVLKNSGGWSDKLKNTFLDERKKDKVFGANNASEAVRFAISGLKTS